VAQCLAGVGQRAFAVSGQPDSLPATHDQPDAEIALECSDRAADPRLGHAHGTRGGGEATGVGHRDERPQLRQLHDGQS
jgi:hypothetical protein